MASTTTLVLIKIKDEETILTIRKLISPYIDHMDEIRACLIIEENDFQNWYDDIYKYLKNKKAADYFDRNERVRLKRTAIRYVIIGEVLYRRSFDSALLRCLTQDEIATSLE